MVKDSTKYASTGGWGFAQFNDGKPADAAVHNSCFSCHQHVKIETLSSLVTHLSTLKHGSAKTKTKNQIEFIRDIERAQAGNHRID